MQQFRKALKTAQKGKSPGKAPGERRWLYVPYDQLTDQVGPLAEERPSELGIVLLECPGKAARRPYHKQKLALVLASQRQFAIEQAKRGVAVRHEVCRATYRDTLAELAEELGPMRVMRPAEYELRTELAPLFADGSLEEIPHGGWLTSSDDWDEATRGKKTWRMDAFYRVVRNRTGYLMDADGSPAGGKLSHDAANREFWDGEPPAPEPPRFRHDEVTKEVGDLVEERYARHPGTLDLGAFAVTRAQVDRAWQWALEECLTAFGPFEDAMSTRSKGLFHTRIGHYLNNLRLLPDQVVGDVLALDIPLNSKEGFLRQVIGWREFMHHVHEVTDGFRKLPKGLSGLGAKTTRPAPRPGDGGFATWAGEEWSAADDLPVDGGARPNALDAAGDLPPAFWGKPCGMACLDSVVGDVMEHGWTHHIPRLMVLSNLATLLDLEPRQLTDWFWASYIDAYDWVVEPNVLGMGTFGLGELFVTKPYVSGAAYIDKMSDFCGGCRFHPKKSCPITELYWAFLARKEKRLEGNNRLAMPLATMRKRKADQKAADQRVFHHVREVLRRGGELTPEGVAEARKP